MFVIEDACVLKFVRGMIPFDNRLAVLLQSLIAPSNDTPISSVVKMTAMTNDKLKSTTVRFRDSDLRLIESLQNKLGLGMIQVIRLAIRRLAEIEKVSSLPVTHDAEVHKRGRS